MTVAKHLEPPPAQRNSVFTDLAALFCRGGLVVQTAGHFRTVVVRSTIQPDGDMTVCVARPALKHTSLLRSHIAEVETRLERAARLIRGTLWAAHGCIAATMLAIWFFGLRDSLAIEDRVTMAAIWIGCSIGSVVVVEWLLRSSLIQKFGLSLVVNRLSRFVADQ